jgi:hypothetical protein
MHFPSFAWKDPGIAIDAELRFMSGFILKQFPTGNKAIHVPVAPENKMPGEMTSTEINGDDGIAIRTFLLRNSLIGQAPKGRKEKGPLPSEWVKYCSLSYFI